MPRHPGMQRAKRLQELSDAIAATSATILDNFWKFRELENKAAALKADSAAEQVKLDRLLRVQADMLETPNISEFGLPLKYSNAAFEEITGRKITS